MELRTRMLITRIQKEPWVAIRWKSCREEAVARELPALVDDAIFRRAPTEALELAFILRGVATEIPGNHVRCKAEACLGSAWRALGQHDLATEQLQRAEELAGTCDDCLSVVHWRLGVLLCHQNQLDLSLASLDRALVHADRHRDPIETCNVLLNRCIVRGITGRHFDGFEDVERAIRLITPDMPTRYFVSAAINALSLAVGCGTREKVEAALKMLDKLASDTKGFHVHARFFPILRWIRGLGHDKLGHRTAALRLIQSAISGLDRSDMIEEKKTAMADLARILRKGKQVETNDRPIRRLIRECLWLETDPKILKILEQARREPSQANLQLWRSAHSVLVPDLEPAVACAST